VTADNTSGVLIRYAAAVLAIMLGTGVAIAQFPGGFDWAYTVISKLASRKHNPAGGFWLSGALLAAVIVLWPVAGHAAHSGGAGPHRWRRLASAALHAGLLGAGLLALEGLLGLDFSSVIRKGHEVLALLTLLGMYAGVLGLYWHRIRQDASFLWPALLVLLPIVAVGASQLTLYVHQRDLGWVNSDWRAMGVPLWLSFAFWQWLAVILLGTGLGHLLLTSDAAPPAMRRAGDAATPANRTAGDAAVQPLRRLQDDPGAP
jgi:hypothetical protein